MIYSIVTMTRIATKGKQLTTSPTVAVHSSVSIEKHQTLGGKARASRLQPTMPLHMTTRRALNKSSPPPESESKTPVPADLPRTKSPKRSAPPDDQPTEVEDHPKKRLRSSQGGSLPKAADSKAPTPKASESETKPNDIGGDTLTMPKKRGRPPRTHSEETTSGDSSKPVRNSATGARKQTTSPTTGAQSNKKGPASSKKNPSSKKPSLRVSKAEMQEQYLNKRELARKYASVEQLHQRQAKLAAQYSLMASLAKETNLILIDKSIELLNNTHDAELGATAWAHSILQGLEKKETERFEQIEYERRLGLIDARHEFNCERKALYDQCDVRAQDSIFWMKMLIQRQSRNMESRGKYLCQISEDVTNIQDWLTSSVEETSDESDIEDLVSPQIVGGKESSFNPEFEASKSNIEKSQG